MMSNLTWVDYVILAIFFFFALMGFWRGFVREIVSLITLIAAFVIAIMFSNALAAFFTSSASVQGAVTQASGTMGMSAEQSVSYLAIGISFAVLFVGTVIIGSIIGFFLNMVFQAGILGVGNRLLGGIFGLGKGFIINVVLIFVIQLTPYSTQPAWAQSRLVQGFQPAIVWLGDIVSPALSDLKEKFDQTFQKVGSSIQESVSNYQVFLDR